MWRVSVYALLLGSALLVGCNNNDDAANDVDRDVEDAVEDTGRDVEDAVEDTGRGVKDAVEDTGRGVNEAVDDVQEGVNDVLDDDNAPNLNSDDRNNKNNEDLVEDPADIRDSDRVDE